MWPLTPAVRRAMLVLSAVAGVFVACSDQAGPGEQGTVLVTLISPNGAEGAALFELPIEGILAVKAPVGTVVESQSAGRRWIALFLSQPGQLVLELTVADQRKPPPVGIREVSGPADQARVVSGYRVEVAPK